MKTFYLTLFLIYLSFDVFSQNTKPNVVDTNEICMPYSVAQKILLDLNNYDKLKELSILDKKEITQLNTKLEYLTVINKKLEEKDSLSIQYIKETENKVEVFKKENEELRKNIKKLKLKNTLYNIISGAVIVPLTYLLITK